MTDVGTSERVTADEPEEGPWVDANLSAREREVVRLKVAGIPDKLISVDLGIEQETVKSYLKRAREKLVWAGHQDTGHLLGLRLAARRAGLIDDLPLI